MSGPTLATRWTIAHQAPLSMGFSRQEDWSGLPFASPGDLPNPGIEPRSCALHMVSCIEGRFFTERAVSSVKFNLVSHVRFFATPWTAAHRASLSITNSWSLPKLMSIESVMPSNHLILCCCFLLPFSIFPSIRVFSNESALPIRWPKYWSFSFNISPSSEQPGLISFRMDWLDLLAV